MTKKMSDGKVYRVYKKPDSHISTKTNEDGRTVAIQFDDATNKLNGPVELEEVDITALVANNSPEELDPFVHFIIEVIVMPTTERLLQIGVDKLNRYIANHTIPAAKKMLFKFQRNITSYGMGIKDGLSGKETKASRILSEFQNQERIQVVDDAFENHDETHTSQKILRSPEEVQKLMDTLKGHIIGTATCIRLLTESVVSDDGTSPEKTKLLQSQLKSLATDEVQRQIALMLEDKNRDFLDQNSYHVLEEFHKGNLIVGESTIPIQNYLSQKNNK